MKILKVLAMVLVTFLVSTSLALGMERLETGKMVQNYGPYDISAQTASSANPGKIFYPEVYTGNPDSYMMPIKANYDYDAARLYAEGKPMIFNTNVATVQHMRVMMSPTTFRNYQTGSNWAWYSLNVHTPWYTMVPQGHFDYSYSSYPGANMIEAPVTYSEYMNRLGARDVDMSEVY